MRKHYQSQNALRRANRYRFYCKLFCLKRITKSLHLPIFAANLKPFTSNPERQNTGGCKFVIVDDKHTYLCDPGHFYRSYRNLGPGQ